MNNSFGAATTAVCLTALTSSIAIAGGKAEVNACVYYPTFEEETQLTVEFSRTSIQCMLHNGHSQRSIKITGIGVHCADMSIVGGKSSSSKGDLCATDPSVWELHFKILGTADSGTARTSWSGSALKTYDSVTINWSQSAPDTVVCSSDALCSTTMQKWTTKQGSVYFIFKPIGE